MPAETRRRTKLFVGVILTAGGWLMTSGLWTGDARADRLTYAVLYCKVRDLREEHRLTNEYLAALGCSQPTVEAIFRVMPAWYRANHAGLEALGTRKIHRELQRMIRKFNMGPRDEAVIARVRELKKAHADALRREREIRSTVLPLVESVMPHPQRMLWRKLRANPPTFGDYRLVGDLTAEQAKALRKLNRVYHRRLAAAANERERLAQSAWFKRETQGVLTETQRADLKKARDNRKKCMPGILKVQEKVLPLPEDLMIP